MDHILSPGLYVRRAFCSQTLTEAASYADLQEVRQPADKWLQNTLTATLQHWSIPKAPRWNLKPFAKQHFDKLSLISILKITLKSGDNIKMGNSMHGQACPKHVWKLHLLPCNSEKSPPFLGNPLPWTCLLPTNTSRMSWFLQTREMVPLEYGLTLSIPWSKNRVSALFYWIFLQFTWIYWVSSSWSERCWTEEPWFGSLTRDGW